MPPPPPPAPPPFLSGNLGSKASSKSAPDRNALLSQIRRGQQLKSVETNDRSAPVIDGSGQRSSRPNTSNMCKTNGPSPLIPPGGLFAQGMPKLRSTTKTGDSSSRPPAFSYGDLPSDSIFSPDKTLGVNETGSSRSQPPSPASKARELQRLHRTDSAGCRNFPSDINIKGPAPAPPPANQKPTFSSDSNAKNKQVGVRRSSSQTSLGPKIRPARPPPNIRPPPPPKSNAVLSSVPPPPPSKPPNVMRRQSFGVSDATFMMNYDGSRLSSKLSVPPPPPRNNSVPNSLSHVPNSSPTTGHISKMTTAPPPPPNRPAFGGSIRVPGVRPPPPPVRAPAPAPPPPPHRFVATPQHLKTNPSSMNSVAPPPPTRISSVSNSVQSSNSSSDFESRFLHRFQNVRNLPPPDKFTNLHKVYSSQITREKNISIRRQPPPPPPLAMNGIGPRGGPPSHQPVLHIQLESRIFANNTAHC